MRPRNEIILGCVYLIAGAIVGGNPNRSSLVKDVGTAIVLVGLICIVQGIVHAVRRRSKT